MGIQVPNAINSNSNAAPFPSLRDKKKRCKLCIETMESGEAEKSINPPKSLCQFCGKCSCQKHLVDICDNCKEARF